MGREWSRARLGDLVSIKHGWPFKSESFSLERHGRPIVISIGNFQYTGGFRFESTAIKEYAGDYPRGYELTPGDILLVMTCQTAGGEILGIPARVPNDGRVYLHNQRLGLVVPRNGTVDPSFLYWLFLCRDFNQYLISSASGTKILHTAPSRIESFEFDLPPLAEQREIARILGALDDRIELHRKANATLEEMIRALFNSWFVDFDPVRAKAAGRAPSGMDTETAKLFPREFVDSELGPIPRAWTPVPVYDLATYVNGAAYKAFQPNDERRGLPIIKIAELKAGITAQTRFSDVAIPEKYRLRNGDILFSWSGNPDTSIDTFVWSHGEAWLNQHIFRVDLRSPDDRSFVLGTLKYLRPVFAEIARNKQTTGLGHVTAGDLQRLLVVKPDARVLAAWDCVAAPLFATVFRNELESLLLARLRDELLPRLLSGALDVGPLATGKEGING